MQVITPYDVQGSGHCVICENGIDRNVQTMAVDTLYDIELPGHFLDGRKYVCEGCLSDIVRACGLMRATEVKELKEELEAFERGYRVFLDALAKSREELSTKMDNVPLLPNMSYASPTSLVVQAEAIEDSKPKRGRPKAQF